VNVGTLKEQKREGRMIVTREDTGGGGMVVFIHLEGNMERGGRAGAKKALMVRGSQLKWRRIGGKGLLPNGPFNEE